MTKWDSKHPYFTVRNLKRTSDMTKQELKEKLIKIRNGGMITPLLEELWDVLKEIKSNKNR